MSDLPATHAASKPGTISGRRITVIVLITLLVTGLLFYWVTTAYSAYNAARRQTDRTWRALAAELDKRYARYEVEVNRAVDEASVEQPVLNRWNAARNEFSRTTLVAHQIEAADRLEDGIASLPQPYRLQDDDSAELEVLYNDFREAEQTQRRVGRSIGSHLLKMMLNLPDPPAFSLAK